MIFNYKGFIMESLLGEFLLESKVHYMSEFIRIVDDISTDNHKYGGVSKVAKFILSCIDKDLDIDQNFINIDKGDKVSFIPDNRVIRDPNTVMMITNDDGGLHNVVKNHPVIDLLGIPKEGLIFPKLVADIPSNRWTIVKEYDGSDAGDSYKRFKLFHIQNVEDPKVFAIVVDIEGKDHGYEPYYEVPNVTRGSIKIGRLVNRLLDLAYKEVDTINNLKRSDYSASDVEKFVNEYTAKVLFNSKIKDSFEIVNGEDIRYWYLEDRYKKNTGQLGSSCMRYKSCQTYLDIYVENPDVCNLLILRDGDFILGRALLWTDTNNKKWIDRVYTYKDTYNNLFSNWAKNNGYDDAYRTEDKIMIKLIDKARYDEYPYMDTFRYFKVYEDGDDDEGCFLSNSNSIIERTYYILQETDGGRTIRM